MVSRSKNKWYRAQKVQKYDLNSQLQALQILTNDDEVENWRLSSFLLTVVVMDHYIWILPGWSEAEIEFTMHAALLETVVSLCSTQSAQN